MLEETVTVVDKGPGYAWVEATSRSACSSCGTQVSCGTSVLGKLFKQRKNRMKVTDHLQLQVGERVVVAMDELELVKAAFYAYLVPVLFMVTTAIVASARGIGDTGVMLLGAASLLAGLLFVSRAGDRTPGGLVSVSLLRRALPADAPDSIQHITIERKPR